MRTVSGIALMLIFVAAGCAENKTRIGEGAGLGGLLGAAAGGIIGHQSGHGLEGALIGGAAGAAGGAAVGSQMNKQPVSSPAEIETASQVTMQQIVAWSKQGLSSDEIISKIKHTNSVYYLTVEDVEYLRSNNVSQRVIEVMQTK